MIWVAGVLGHHVGGRRTRALQHYDQFVQRLDDEKQKNGQRKGGGEVRKLTTHADTAGRQKHSTRGGKNRRSTIRDRVVCRQLLTGLGATLRRRHDRNNRAGFVSLQSRAVVRTGGGMA